MKKKIEQHKMKLALGLVSVVVGLLASSFAMFGWIEQTGSQNILGGYGRYICGFGGFGAMIFGATLVNDFMQLKRTFVKGISSTPMQTQQVILNLDEQIRVFSESCEVEKHVSS